MSELDALMAELLQTLSASRSAVEAELKLYSGTGPIDRGPVRRLQASVLEFAGQAELLVRMLKERSADETAIRAAEDLASFFQGAQYRLEFMLEAGQE